MTTCGTRLNGDEDALRACGSGRSGVGVGFVDWGGRGVVVGGVMEVYCFSFVSLEAVWYGARGCPVGTDGGAVAY
jgi:hypothetical protein